jgi:hypothetical protein
MVKKLATYYEIERFVVFTTAAATELYHQLAETTPHLHPIYL